MYKRSVAVGLSALVLITTASVADAATKKKPVPKPTKRTVTWNYQGIGGLGVAKTGGTFGDNVCPILGGCYTLTTQKYETGVKLHSVDTSGHPVLIAYYLDGDAAHPDFACGDTTFTVSKGSTVTLRTVVDPVTCQGVPTQGSVTLTVTGKK